MQDESKEAPKMDPADLWREEVFTDRKVGTIRRLSPVKTDGAPDPARQTVFLGEASLYTPAGSLPLTFEVPGSTLEQAVGAYGAALEEAFTQALEELEEARRRAASSLVIPKGTAGLAGGGLGPGLPPGKLKLP